MTRLVAISQRAIFCVNKKVFSCVSATMPAMRASALQKRTFLPSLPCLGALAAVLLAATPACDKGSSAPKTADPQEAAMQPRTGQAEPVAAPVPAESGALADGAACSSGADCQSGVCEGIGCAADAQGTCMAKSRPCTYDLVPYCGCDGQTFQSSSVCPGQRYERAGACEDTEQEASPEASK